MNRLLVLSVFAVTVGGCTLSDGDFFAVVDARMSGAVDGQERALEDGWLQLASDYQVRIDSLTLETTDLVLTSAQGATSFDPANPPEGYSLCHNGHCHASDGSLVDYEDVAAELGGGAGATDIMAFELEELSYDQAFDFALECEPECGLRSASAITGLRVPLVSLRASGLVRDSRADPRLAGEEPWSVDANLAARELALVTGLEIPVGRGESETVAIQIDLPVHPAVFDTVDWALSPVDGETINLSDMANQDALVLALGELNVDILVER